MKQSERMKWLHHAVKKERNTHTHIYTRVLNPLCSVESDDCSSSSVESFQGQS